MWMPQSLNLASCSGLNTMSQDDIAASIGPSSFQNLARLLDVVADAGGAPHVIDGVLVAGIVDREPLRDLRPDVAEVLELRLVELLEYAGLDLPLQEIGGRHHHVVAGLSGEELGLQRLIGVERVVPDLDAGFLAERFDHRRLDIVRPVVDVDRALLGRQRRGGSKQPDRDESEDARHGVRLLAAFSFRSAGQPPSKRGCRRRDARRRAAREPAPPARP